MFTYIPLVALVYTGLGLAGFVAGLLVRHRVGPRAVAGAFACLVTALAAAPVWAMPFILFTDQGMIELALIWIWIPILQLISLALFILASMSRFRPAAR